MTEFVPFRFLVNLHDSRSGDLLCSGSFSEVSGFELTMEPRSIAEGGRNWGEHQRSGVTRFAPMVLKRGVTHVNDLWSWFDITTRGANYGYRMHGEIILLGNPLKESGGYEYNPVMTWKLTGVLATRFKGPDMNATASQVAIEELHLVHEGLELKRTPSPGSGTATEGSQ
ncbi:MULTISPECIES: phage tail protein [Marinobacter]|uniref:Phage tail protein n=1 Tax=Marinobacter xiaoshiensis TaxID=3073652 RepID=A0ABU2HI82_9GAMM|nr:MULTISPECIES: phage tail protein [unclassified Marinobacter]MBK1874923.1 phage tail protein [Marinobacter sp. 1-3A]MBK1888281.1 phage tail protein [Marinobacter sp. DY40_1A1]MDS1310757.1 phage tail protein [Marinobacter sp. F60267]